MIKKAIAGLLSVVISSVMIASDFNTGKQISEFNDASRTSESTGTDAKLKGKNSFGKYIENTASEQKEMCAQPLNMKADPDNYHVSGIDFDIETGKLSVISTQSADCTMKIEFINDDDPDNIQVLKNSVKAGTRIETTTMVDVGMLPQFFQIRCVLADVHGSELGEPFISRKYMRFMQELAVATVDDYDEQYVVNLDESEDTNFFVLSEDTIVAESSEEENTLVSADYDNEVYVFENINDSIRYLSEGDYFYAQPNDMDMVAVNVESIEIDGDTATIRGGGEIDDMFDVIKIEVGSDDIDASALEEAGNAEGFTVNGIPTEENEDYSVVYEGVIEDEEGLPALGYSVLSYSEAQTPQALQKAVDFDKPDSTKSIKIPIEFTMAPLERDTNGNIIYDKDGEKMRKKYQAGHEQGTSDFLLKDHDVVDKEKNYADYNLLFDFSATLSITLEANITVFKFKHDRQMGIDGSFDVNFTAQGTAKGDLTFGCPKMPITIFPSLNLELGIEVKVGIECAVSISASRTYYFGLNSASVRNAADTDILYSDNDFEEEKKNKQENEFKLDGKFYIQIKPSIGFSLFKYLRIGVETPIKLQVDTTFFSINNTDLDPNNSEIKIGNTAILPPPDSSISEPIHACKACFLVKPSLTIKVTITYKLFKKHKFDLAERKWNFEPWHASWTYGEMKKGECQHYLYPTDIDITGDNDKKLTNLVLEVDNVQTKVNAGDTERFFLDPNTKHSFKIYSEGEEIQNGTFSIKSEYSTYEIKLGGGIKKESSAPVTTTTVKTENEPIHTVESVMSKIKEETPERLMIEYGQLGDNVYYALYANGLLYISGYGPMNKDDDPVKNKSLVKNVFFEDYATCMRNMLEEDIDDETLIDEYIEKYQDALCSAYLEKDKEHFIDILNKDYGVEKDDPLLDEMIDDYIYANSEDVARKYFEKNGGEFGYKLDELRKELLADLDDKVITTIGKSVFSGCRNLESITYEGSPNEGNKAFDLPDSIVSIEQYAFSSCSSLPFGDVVFGDRLEKIGYHAFDNCVGITSIQVPFSVKEIEGGAFINCSNMEKAVIEADLKTLSLAMFCRCQKLQELTLPESLPIQTTNGVYLGDNDYSLYELFRNEMDNAQGYYYPPKDTLTKVSILRGDTINKKAFEQLRACSNISTIALPQGIKHINDEAFSYLKVKDIICSDESKDLSFSELFSDLEYVGQNAFSGCSNLQIGDLVFGDKLKNIDVNAFNNVNGITSVYIPESVENIGHGAFQNCSSLVKVDIRANITKIIGGLFFNSPLEELTLPTFIETDEWHNIYSKNRLNIIFWNNSDVPYNHLYNNSDRPPNLTKLKILSGDTIPEHYFDGFKNVTTLELPSELLYAEENGTHAMANSIKEVIYNGTDENWEKLVENKKPYNEPLDTAYRIKSTEEVHIYGDANCDGEIDMSDAVLIMQAFANPNKYGVNGTSPKHITSEGWKYADADGNGLTVNDALRIQQYLLGLIDSLV